MDNIAHARATKTEMTFEEWEEKGTELFGDNKKEWKFICPSCGYVASIQDYVNAKAQDSIAFSCIGRYIKGETGDFLTQKGAPCNYAGGGLFRINPITIKDKGDFFDFAPVDTDET